jgi:hypothetical protein
VGLEDGVCEDATFGLIGHPSGEATAFICAVARFDDPSLVSCAGLVPVMLASDVGLYELVADRVDLPGDIGVNQAGKGACGLGAALSGRLQW